MLCKTCTLSARKGWAQSKRSWSIKSIPDNLENVMYNFEKCRRVEIEYRAVFNVLRRLFED